jgi:hypothetical protein
MLVADDGVGAAGCVAVGVPGEPAAAGVGGVRFTAPHAESIFFPSEMTVRRREELAIEVGGGPAAFDNIGSGRRVSRRLVSSTLTTRHQNLSIIIQNDSCKPSMRLLIHITSSDSVYFCNLDIT